MGPGFGSNRREDTMAKGRQRGNREPKRPKTAVKKPIAGTLASQYQLPVKLDSTKKTGK